MGSIRRPPIGPATRNGGFVGNTKTAPDAEKFERVPGLQFANQWRNRIDGGNEWRSLGNLRADVHLDTANDDIRHFGCTFVNGRHAIERNRKFVFALAGRDILVRRRRNIGIHPERDSCALLLSGRDLIDVIELSFAFDIERVNLLLECIFDLFARFAHAGEGASRGIAASPDNTIEFATRYDVESGSNLGKEMKNRPI